MKRQTEHGIKLYPYNLPILINIHRVKQKHNNGYKYVKSEFYMSRIADGETLQEILRWMDVAKEVAEKSPCARDKRGVVIVSSNGMEIGSGFNSPVQGYICEPKYCDPTCKEYAVHAEMKAITDSVRRGNGNELIGARMYHARVQDGEILTSRKPRCYPCSKHLVEFGIAEFVLKNEEGYVIYPIQEFNMLSLNSLMKN